MLHPCLVLFRAGHQHLGEAGGEQGADEEQQAHRPEREPQPEALHQLPSSRLGMGVPQN